MSKKSLVLFSEELLKIFPRLIRGMFGKQTDPLLSGSVTIPQYLSLDIIDIYHCLKMKDIAKYLNISLPAATGLISRLHRIGMVKRSYDKKDRRLIFVSLTPKGKRVLEQIRLQRHKVIQKAFGGLREHERQTYLRLLKKVEKNLYPKNHEK